MFEKCYIKKILSVTDETDNFEDSLKEISGKDIEVFQNYVRVICEVEMDGKVVTDENLWSISKYREYLRQGFYFK